MGVDSVFSDVRIALRSLRRAPGYTAVVVLTLGLGIGANSAIYSVIHATLIQSLPYEGGDQSLVQFRQTSEQTGASDIGFSVQEILEYRQRSSIPTQFSRQKIIRRSDAAACR